MHVCDECGHLEIAYNSCRDRHCPKCQGSKREAWVQARLETLLPICYFHQVFTLPDGPLHAVMLLNQEVMYPLFFSSAAETMHLFAADPKYLGAQIGFTGILHTWGQTLIYHPHLHFIVTAGGLSLEGERWVDAKYGDRFLFPVKAMSIVMRGKFISKLERVYKQGELQFAGKIAHLAAPGAFERFLRELAGKAFFIYSKPPFGSPEDTVEYIGRYTHGVAISNYRLLDIEGGKSTRTIGGRIRFRYQDNKEGGKQKVMSLSANEFIRRFLLHILPHGFKKIRHYGFLAGGVVKKKLALARKLLAARDKLLRAAAQVTESFRELVWRCPVCQVGRMCFEKVVDGRWVEIWQSSPLIARLAFDTS